MSVKRCWLSRRIARNVASVPLDEPDPAAIAARVRAALGYADLNIKGSEPLTGITEPTLTRIVSPTNPRGFKTPGEMEKIIRATRVPRWFLERGFEGANVVDADTTDARLQQLEQQVRYLRQRERERGERETGDMATAINRMTEMLADRQTTPSGQTPPADEDAADAKPEHRSGHPAERPDNEAAGEQ